MHPELRLNPRQERPVRQPLLRVEKVLADHDDVFGGVRADTDHSSLTMRYEPLDRAVAAAYG